MLDLSLWLIGLSVVAVLVFVYIKLEKNVTSASEIQKFRSELESRYYK